MRHLYIIMYVIQAYRLYNVHLYTGFSDTDYALRGHHQNAIGSTYTFLVPPLVHGRWVRIMRIGSNGYLHMCEVQVHGNRKTQDKSESCLLNIVIIRINTRQSCNGHYLRQNKI